MMTPYQILIKEAGNIDEIIEGRFFCSRPGCTEEIQRATYSKKHEEVKFTPSCGHENKVHYKL